MENDRLRLWHLFILGRSVVTGAFLALLIIVNGLVPPPSLHPLFLLAWVQLATNGFYFYLWKRQDIALLGSFSFGLEIVLITLIIYLLGPDGHVFLLAYLWPIIMGGWLRGRKSIGPLTLLSTLSYAVLIFLERRGLARVQSVLSPDNTSQALVLSLPYLAFVSLLVWMMTREMERSEDRLRSRNRDLHRVNFGLRYLVAANEELSSCLDRRGILSFALRKSAKITGHERAAVYIEDGGTVRLSRQHGLPRSFEMQRSYARLPAQWMSAQRTEGESLGIVVEALSGEEEYLFATPGKPVPQVLIHVPLQSPHGLEGMLTIASSETSPLDQSEAHLVQILGHQLGIALQNARLLNHVRHDRDLLRGILAHMGEGVFVVDSADRVLVANRSAAALLGIRDGEELPAWFLERMAEDDEADTLQGARRVVDSEDATISVSTTQLFGSEELPQSTIYVARDITEESRIQQMRSDFVAYVSHELRTPLTTIKMLIRMLLTDAPEDTKQREYLSIVDTQVARQARLVSNLLDFTRLEGGKYELFPETVDPRLLVEAAVSACRPLAEQKGLEIGVACSEAPRAFVSNRGGLEQVLVNLLSNGVKFTDPGGHVSVSCWAKDGEVLFEVEDSGIGMTEEQLGRIFTKFYTVRNPQKRGEGTGLGLVISDMIVKELGGRIEVASEPDVGTCFQVRLPLVRDPSELAPVTVPEGDTELLDLQPRETEEALPWRASA